ncbi:hypothetical protein TIFTF001_030808 [Ficus carica]|uniref:Uncharacterized protein n=1 Tax=Ficus carica TaxID=3494 RepID=A0AA88DTS2_FICCA|nr:hypothetical protein TIFTF001_030808 [Ficus carica]
MISTATAHGDKWREPVGAPWSWDAWLREKLLELRGAWTYGGTRNAGSAYKSR